MADDDFSGRQQVLDHAQGVGWFEKSLPFISSRFLDALVQSRRLREASRSQYSLLPRCPGAEPQLDIRPPLIGPLFRNVERSPIYVQRPPAGT